MPDRDPYFPWLLRLSPDEEKAMRRRVVLDSTIRAQSALLAEKFDLIKARPVKKDEGISNAYFYNTI